MWTLDNKTPYAADRNWTRDKRGMPVWIVAVKATFDIGPKGKLTLADDQPPPVLQPLFRGDGDPSKCSLRYESDLLAVKPGTDILLEACAHAPNGRPATTVPVSLSVAGLEKTLLVHGPRVYYRSALGLGISAPLPFVTQPIVYESAFGGSDTSDPDPRKHRIYMRNPVGKGFVVDDSTLERQLAHSIEYPHGDFARVGPAGFGPLTSFWSPRAERAGTYDATWEKNRKPFLPDDHDERAALAAPDDQRPLRPLRGGETIAVQNMTPEGRLVFQLPTLTLTFATRVGGRIEQHQGLLTTVLMELELKKVSMVWQTSLPVRARDVDYLDATEIGQLAGPA